MRLIHILEPFALPSTGFSYVIVNWSVFFPSLAASAADSYICLIIHLLTAC